MPDPTVPREDESSEDSSLLHQFKNHLFVAVGFCDLLLRDLPDDDPRRADVLEVHKGIAAAIELLPELSARMR